MISVLIAAYNAEKYIVRCLKSLEKQTFKDFEVIVVNDCSTDTTKDIIESFANKTVLNIRIVNLMSNRGVAYVRNKCLKLATGSEIYFVDADDWVEEECLAKLHAKMEATGSDVVTCDFFIESNSNKFNIIRVNETDLKQACILAIRGEWAVVWRYLFKAEIVRKNQITFMQNIDAGEDYLFIVRILLCAHRFTKISVPLYHYTIYNQTSVMRGVNIKGVNDQFAATLLLGHLIELKYNTPDYVEALNFRYLYLKKEIFKMSLNVWKNWNKQANKYANHKDISIKDRLIYKVISLISYFLR